ncbi:MAG: S8 family serine peptidase [Oscillochloris sp.]|nr:S8 family serine peptidase [Oscillochloris sp.]
MHHRHRMFVVLMLVALACTAMPPAIPRAALAAVQPAYAPNELIVKLRTSDPHAPAALAGAAGFAAVGAAEPLFAGAQPDAIGLAQVWRLHLAAGVDPLDAASRLMRLPEVVYAEPNYQFTLAASAAAIPSDSLFAQQWALHNTGQDGGVAGMDIRAVSAWETSVGSPEVLIAVVDTGVDYTHPDLSDGRVRTDIDRDFVNGDDDAQDDNRHGTLVAAVIGAAHNGGGIAGVLPEVAILPVKVISGAGLGFSGTIARGIRYAADQGADVINLSLGGFICTQVIADAIAYATLERGALVVAASGNNSGALSYPARLPATIAVGAIDNRGLHAEFSNSGPGLDLVAPGVDIISAAPNNSFNLASGTSLAAPYVAAGAGLLLAQRPDLTNHQLAAILRASARDLGPAGFDEQYGHGLLDLSAALQLATPNDPPPLEVVTCADCPASVAAAEDYELATALSLLRRFDERVLAASPFGQRLRTTYRRHSAELATHLLADPALRRATAAYLSDMLPAIAALSGDGRDVTIEAGLISDGAQLLEQVAARSSPALAAELRDLWASTAPEQYTGRSANAVWAEIQNRQTIYLPLVQQ